MKLGFELSRVLKRIPQTSAEREVRAMFLANACAFSRPIDPLRTYNEQLEDQVKEFKKVVSQVNENISVDPRKAVDYFARALRLRWELINGITDPFLLRAAMQSTTAEISFSNDEREVATLVVGMPDFTQMQGEMSVILKQFAEIEN